MLIEREGLFVPEIPIDPPLNPGDGAAPRNGDPTARGHDSSAHTEHEAHALLEACREKIEKFLRHPVGPKSDIKPKPRWLHRVLAKSDWSRPILIGSVFLVMGMAAISAGGSILSSSLSIMKERYFKNVSPHFHWILPGIETADPKKPLAFLVTPFDSEPEATTPHEVRASMKEWFRRDVETQLQVFETNLLPTGNSDDYSKARSLGFAAASKAHVVLSVKRHHDRAVLWAISRLVPNARPEVETVMLKWDGAHYHFPGPRDEE